MTLSVILLTLGGIVAFLLLTPLAIEVDSMRGLYRVSYRGVACGNLVFEEGRILLQLWVLGWRRTFDLLSIRKKPATLEHEAQEKHAKKRIGFKKMARKARAALRTFQVKDFYLDIDTDDFLLNAWLFPIARWLSNERRTFRVNFTGTLAVRMHIETRPAKILLALLH